MTKVDRRIGQKRTEMSYQSIDTFHIIALQNLDEYDRPNQINIRIYFNQIINSLAKYKKYKHNFLIEDLLFVLSVMNETNVIFVNNAQESLINSKIYKTACAINLSQIENWSRAKG